MKRRFIGLGCLSMLWLQWGCAEVVVPGTVAGAGEIYRYTTGNVAKQTYLGSMDQVTLATELAIEKMGIELTRTEFEGAETRLYGETPEMDVIIRLKSVTPTATRVIIDTRKNKWIKDKATATEILTQIRAIMKTKIAPVKQVSSVYVKNECDVTIKVIVYYLAGPEGAQTWAARGWFVVSPGITKQIADTPNRHVYLYAESVNGRKLFWAGKDSQNFKGKPYGFFKVNMGAKFTDYTQTFTCDE